jgi:hypothetical protein
MPKMTMAMYSVHLRKQKNSRTRWRNSTSQFNPNQVVEPPNFGHRRDLVGGNNSHVASASIAEVLQDELHRLLINLANSQGSFASNLSI